MAIRRIFFALFGACLVFPLVARGGSGVELNAKDLALFTPIAEAIRSTTSFTLYEGLPHQATEAELLAKETADKKTLVLHDFPFYAQPMELTTGDLATLRDLAIAPDSYWSYGGPKKCDGFHPDYCLRWSKGAAHYDLLICFGCREMKLSGPQSELIVDIRGEAFDVFKTTLAKHRVHRPAKQ